MKTLKKIVSNTLMLAALAVAPLSLADALVWQASLGDKTVYLAGTIHMLKPSDYPLPEEYEQVFAKADTIVLETDMQATQSPEFAMLMSQKMRLPAGQSLSTVLNEEVYAQVQAAAEKRGLPLQALANYQPAFVALTLYVMELQTLGFAEGVDAKYANKASEAGKVLAALETPEQQLGFMLAMAELDANDFMRYSLADITTLPELMGQMVSAFKTGDAEMLYRLGAEPMIDYSRALYDTLLTERNQSWVADIEGYLTTPETELVMVGALHLAGPDGLPALLAQKGITVKRF
ncbi:TraB/GumN family protein [Gilvimarinus agarilyticus]|uniref:TraB/GumN family protein n=1 Tax=Gilvimarinus sp. 2_MG-2023 TaxID=3062666 RepID=UPI001C08A5A4|nr:TraB/GumN family protein [Gilvimarinus sp. 2_MG-2023]MBU2885592.1 TraB/GumN family protein [Gilvimarinus agarilyticus]MDO6570459.1 TraB/GumN family protein [Gilvimarinus sp. 2_MG-2023]